MCDPWKAPQPTMWPLGITTMKITWGGKEKSRREKKGERNRKERERIDKEKKE